MTITADSTDPVTASFTNERVQTSLTINKAVEGPDTVDLSAEVFELTVTCTGGFTEDPYVIVGEFSATSPFTIDELPYGAECSAVETPDDRFATTDLTGAVTLGTDPTAIDILNETGSFVLDIDSIVNSTRPIDPDDDFTFTVVATLPDGTVITEVIDITTVDGNGGWESALFPTGTVVTVTLDAPEEWNVLGNGTLDLVIGTDVGSLNFDVERNLVSLTIDKLLENVPSNADFNDHAFDVSVTCSDGFVDSTHELPDAFTVASTESLVIDELPLGSTCEVTEAADEFFDATYAPSNSITLVADVTTNNVTITNTGNDALQQEYEVPPSGPLAFTGATVGTLLWFATLLLAGGVFFLMVGRRRDPEAV